MPINGLVFQLIYYTFRRTYYLRSGNNGFLQAKYKHKKDVLGLDQLVALHDIFLAFFATCLVGKSNLYHFHCYNRVILFYSLASITRANQSYLYLLPAVLYPLLGDLSFGRSNTNSFASSYSFYPLLGDQRFYYPCKRVPWVVPTPISLINSKKRCASYLRFYGSTVLRFYGSTVLRFYGSTVLRFYGSTVLRFYGSTVLRFYGSTVLRFYGLGGVVVVLCKRNQLKTIKNRCCFASNHVTVTRNK